MPAAGAGRGSVGDLNSSILKRRGFFGQDHAFEHGLTEQTIQPAPARGKARMAEIEELTTYVEGGEEYELRSNEDRTAYTLRFKTEDLIVSLQGEALEAFLKEYNLIKLQYPQYGADQRLAQIWDQGGYSWLAAGQQEEEG